MHKLIGKVVVHKKHGDTIAVGDSGFLWLNSTHDKQDKNTNAFAGCYVKYNEFTPSPKYFDTDEWTVK